VSKLIRALFGPKRNVPIDSSSNRVFLGMTYFFYFGQLGIFMPYVGLFLDDKGFSSAQIGTMLAITAIFRMLGPNLWANKADKNGNAGEVLRFGSLLSFLVFTAIFVVQGYWLLTLIFCLMMLFWTAVLPQLEVITLSATAKSKGGYGKLRLWGSVGFIVCSLLAGSLIDVYGPSVVAMITCVSLLLIYVSSLLIVNPQIKAPLTPKAGGDWKQAFSLVFIVFMLANTLLQVSFGSYYNFFAMYMNDLSYTGLETGAFIAMGVVAEVFIFIYAAKLVKRFNVLHLLAVSILLTGLRWLGLAYFAHIGAVIILCQILHAFSFALSHVASMYFLVHHFSDRFQSRAQAIYLSVCFGLGSAIGSIIAGYLWDDGLGATISFVFSGAVAFLAGALLIVLIIYQGFYNKRMV
jgi:PPP family 3-phenylpropionic acid transporter